MNWVFGSVDWGWRNPGVLQVWGVDERQRAFLLHEVYRVGRDLEWWADRAQVLTDKYGVVRWECDPSRPEAIHRFNVRLARSGGGWGGRKAEMAGGAINARPPGLSVCAERFKNNSVYILESSLESRDDELVRERKPMGLSEEIPSYIYKGQKDGQAVKEEPRADAADHSCDAFRYGMMFLDTHDWRSVARDDGFPHGSWGRIMEHDKVLNKEHE